MKKMLMAILGTFLFTIVLSLGHANSHEQAASQEKWKKYTEQWQERMNTMHEQMDQIHRTTDDGRNDGRDDGPHARQTP